MLTGLDASAHLAPSSEGQAARHAMTPKAWRALRLFNLYRLLMAGLFTGLQAWDSLPRPLGDRFPQLFYQVTLLYLAFAVASVLTLHWRRPGFTQQLHLQILVDVIVLTLLIHASGGLQSGLGILLLVTLAGGALLMTGETAGLFAAIATLAVLGEQTYAQLGGGYSAGNYTHAGLLGAGYFGIALLSHLLARRARESEALARRRGVDLANLSQLNEHVIQRLQSGVLVVDDADRIRLMNSAAQALLGVAPAQQLQTLATVSPALEQELITWRADPAQEPEILPGSASAAQVLPRFAMLGAGTSSGVLIFLEDPALMSQQAQQMKLAALGRLTASIAHEIRNPLAAISHAAQLLAESPALTQGDQRLTQIVWEQSRRMNTIIENVLQLSRRDRARPENVSLKSWLEGFLEDFCPAQGVDPRDVPLNVSPADVEVRVDPGQLRQVLSNLCENALRHGTGAEGRPPFALRCASLGDSLGYCLEVVDEGPGIPPEIAQQIFEPFFTTKRDGTGLGLYLARELCEVNQARLTYQPLLGKGSCFRITFSQRSTMDAQP